MVIIDETIFFYIKTKSFLIFYLPLCHIFCQIRKRQGNLISCLFRNNYARFFREITSDNNPAIKAAIDT